jgi:diguanylate cyclase (GGDEF)-like protein
VNGSEEVSTPDAVIETLKIPAGDTALLGHDQTAKSAYLTVLTGPGIGTSFKIRGSRTVFGRAPTADLVVEDEGVSRRHGEVQSGVEDGFVLVDLGSRNGIYVDGERTYRRALEDGDRFQIGVATVIKFSLQDGLEENFQRKLYEDAVRDGLTGVFNTRYFREQLKAEVAFCKRHSAILSLLLVDVDHFKHVNDSHGHLVGDHVLREFAKRVSGAVRAEDLVARYGGDEFVLILRDIDADGAMVAAERIRRLVKERPFEFGGASVSVTVSIGMATLRNGSFADSHEFIGAADAALYDAKSDGRDCSMAAQGKPETSQ